jgi:hypothetical protein
MKTKYESERTAALVEEVIAILERLENAPESPLTTFLPTKLRRKARRTAKQLRKGQLQPRHPNSSVIRHPSSGNRMTDDDP